MRSDSIQSNLVIHSITSIDILRKSYMFSNERRIISLQGGSRVLDTTTIIGQPHTFQTFQNLYTQPVSDAPVGGPQSQFRKGI